MRASNFKHLVKEGIENTWFNKVMSFASFCILLVGLLICGLSALFIQDIKIVIGNVENENMAIIYMLQDTTEEQVKETQKKLEKFEYVTDVVHVTKEEALEIMMDKMSYAAEDVDQIFGGLDGNEFMPDSFKMTIVDLAKIDEVSAQYIFVVEEGIQQGGFCEHFYSVIKPSVPCEFIAVNNTFIPHGSLEALYEHSGLSANKISEKVISCVNRI